jgi:competence protein ComEA
MNGKRKYELNRKLQKIRQLIIIILMVISGLWYVTKGREKDNAVYAFSEQNASKITMDKDESECSAGIAEPAPDRDKKSAEASTADREFFIDESQEEMNEENMEVKTITQAESADSHEDRNAEKTKESDESGDAGDRTSAYSDPSGLINLNHATLKELESLPGVGPATAKNIIDYREKYGGFADIEEIKNVKRIGDKTYEKLKKYITV